MDITNLANINFTEKTKADIFNSILTATKAFAMFKAENRGFFNYTPKDPTLNGYLLSYAVESQLTIAANKPTATYYAYTKPVNGYKYNALVLETDNFTCTVGRTKNPNKLLPRSNYKADFARLNSHATGNQLRLETMPDINMPLIQQEKYYAQVTYLYNYELDKLVHTSLVIPDGSYKETLYRVNLIQDTTTTINYTPQPSEEEDIVHLKEKLILKLKNQA